MTIKFYYDNISGPARSVYQALLLNDCLDKVELIYINLLAKKQLEPEFIAINPYHTVPTLVDTEVGVTLYESCAILQYLSEKLEFKQVGVPTEGAARWKCINYLHNQPSKVGTLYPAVLGRYKSLLVPGASMDEELIKKTIDGAQAWLPIFDKQIGDNGGYIAADYVTVADLACYAQMGTLRSYKYGFDLYNFKPYANIVAWFAKMEALKGFDEVYGPMAGFADAVAALGPSSCQDEQ